VPQHASQEQEPFVIELVVPKNPMAQGSPVEEQQQLEDHDLEDKADKEQPPPSDMEYEKMYPPVGFGLYWNTWASPPPLGT
jgi:hypothetical protein